MAFESGNVPKETLDFLAAKKAESDKNAGKGLALLLLLILIGISVAVISNSDNQDSRPRQVSGKIDAPSLPYHSDEIIAQAKADMATKRYQYALDELEGLHPADSQGPSVRSMVAKAMHEVQLADLKEKRLGRLAYVKDYERALLGAGMDATVRATGRDADTLTMTFILVNRPFVYKSENDHELTKALRALGFRNVHLSDGYDSSWSYKLD